MCQNSGGLMSSGSGLLSMMLQPISPRRSGEFSTQVDMSCAAAGAEVESESQINSMIEDVVRIATYPPSLARATLRGERRQPHLPFHDLQRRGGL
jgi:hypothetical protein